jgi:3-oxoacyl-[acyl-carrier-protein] synthase II
MLYQNHLDLVVLVHVFAWENMNTNTRKIKTEVVITGIGLVSPHGIGWNDVFKKACLFEPVFDKWPSDQLLPSATASVSLVKKLETEKYFTERQLRMVDKAVVMSTIASDLALKDAKLNENLPADDCAILFSTVRCEHPSIYKFAIPILTNKPRFLNGANFPLIARNIACGQVAINFGLRGMSSVLSSGPNASLQSLARAYQMIRTGRTSIAIVGATESLSKFSINNSRFIYNNHLTGSQPAFFSKSTGQIIPSEGSCVFVLESHESAQRRNIQPYAKIDGYFSGRVGDQSMEKGVHEGLAMFLKKIGSSWSNLNFISSSNAGSNQKQELAELNTFINYIHTEKNNPLITSARSVFGEAESCATALEVAVAIEAIRSGEILPTWHVGQDAPKILNIVRKSVREKIGCSLVSAVDSSGDYCFLQLSQV